MDLLPSDSWLASHVRDGDWPVFSADVSREVSSPREALASLLSRPYPFLLESASGIHKIARYSLVGSDPYQVFWSKGNTCHLSNARGRRSFQAENPINVLRSLLGERPTPVMSSWEGFACGAVGFFGYDMKNHIEELPDTVEDDLDMPEMFWVFVDEALVFDRKNHTVRLLVQAPFRACTRKS